MEHKIILPSFGVTEWQILWGVLFSAFIGIAYAVYLIRRVLAVKVTHEKMLEVALAIEEGAMAYLAKQIRTMSVFVAIVAAILYFIYVPLFGQRLA
ncbi:MAG: sodium/proton-translocating pyrophosphatase, partial [Elusimicrobiota bacterium]